MLFFQNLLLPFIATLWPVTITVTGFCDLCQWQWCHAKTLILSSENKSKRKEKKKKKKIDEAIWSFISTIYKLE